MPPPTIKGLQELQDYNVRLVAAMKTSGAAGKAVKVGTSLTHRYAVAITHVVTRALAASHGMKLTELQGEVSIRGAQRNPRSGALTSEYGPEEHARGGTHAFYRRTVDEHGDQIVKQAVDVIVKEIS